MFNRDFFPTPTNVIEQMLSGYDVTNKVCLEPSAGKGDIVDWLKSHGAKEVIACENNQDLKTIVASKCKVIADDFLTVRAEHISHVDFIVMNPPFSADEHHIVHAWEIAAAGCTIIALCNWNTVMYPDTKKQHQLKNVIRDYGSKLNLGDVFTDAERKTDVEIGLVIIEKPRTSSNDGEFEGFYMDEEPEELGSYGVMQHNFVRELVNRYVAAIKLFDQQLELAQQMNTLTNNFYSSKIAMSVSENERPKTRSEFKKDLQKAAWDYVFKQLNMDKFTTQGLRNDINRFVENQQNVPFTMANIYKMVEIVIGTHSQRMDRALMEVVEKLTRHTDENRYHVEGWKTNSHYMLNQKFIMPYAVQRDYKGRMEMCWNGTGEQLSDMQKALCHLFGLDYSIQTRLSTLVSDLKPSWGEWFSWFIFEVKGYKKGTMHFKFQNIEDWATINQHIARIYGYPLPEAIKKHTKTGGKPMV